ncbi:MAG: hypothetical protein QM786_01330 [Breznakibacter sp.]
MKKALSIKWSFEKLLVHLFFVFFCAQILSPYFLGRTFYLEFLVALFNPYFHFWIYRQKIPKRFVWVLLALFLMLLFFNIQMFIKMVFMIVSVCFLFYVYEKKLFFWRPYLVVSIFFAVGQFIFLFINPNFAISIGPTAIAQKIWGVYATKSLTNFYTIFFIPRVSGLSREAGFFAAFLISVLFFLYIEKRRTGHSIGIWVIVLLLLGFVLSFSKMSLFIFPLLFVERFRKVIDKVPFLAMLVFFVSAMIFLWIGKVSYLVDPVNESFLHRFGGYALFPSLNLGELIFGTGDLSSVGSPLIGALCSMGYDSFAGLSGFMIEKGILFSFLFFLMFLFFGVSTSGLLVLLFLTINVQMDTSQNFVVMAYFLCFKFFIDKQYSLFP